MVIITQLSSYSLGSLKLEIPILCAYLVNQLEWFFIIHVSVHCITPLHTKLDSISPLFMDENKNIKYIKEVGCP